MTQALEIQGRLVKEQWHFVTTSAVLLELCNALSTPDRNLRKTAIDLVTMIQNSDKWTVIHMDENLMTKGFDLFKQMQDKSWELVDCISIIVAREQNITKIFTYDDDFTQAGFTILL